MPASSIRRIFGSVIWGLAGLVSVGLAVGQVLVFWFGCVLFCLQVTMKIKILNSIETKVH